MKLKSFYRAFRKIAPQYNWGVKDYPDCIWGEGKDSELFFNVCPITALHASRNPKVVSYGLSGVNIAGRELKLSEEDIELIALAADKNYDHLNLRGKIVRKALLRAIGRA